MLFIFWQHIFFAANTDNYLLILKSPDKGLASRYDIEALKTVAAVDSGELQNFFADLYYLGVFSRGEIIEYCSPDFNYIGLTGQRGVLVKIADINEL